ncbi:reverse transcriptase [Plakobranchus ocellatus]|uniref:Reverse transcriptase n=1 Tax=Plakobranchus ocellatus TaxID=259542 RepID=A0AAV4ALR0_9GAST|nr:reverse transcriptase [Plakobranchus ocellatus]
MRVRLDALMNWSRMSFKPQKPRSRSTRRGKLNEDVCFKVTSQDIPRICQKPAKSQGRLYDSSTEGSKHGTTSYRQIGLPRKFKMWCLLFMLIPKFLCLLLLEQEISTASKESTEVKINRFTRKWPKCSISYLNKHDCL